MKQTELVFFNYSFTENTGENKQLKKLIGLKTNENLVIQSLFEMEVDSNHYKHSVQDVLIKFEAWIKNPYNCKFVTFYMQEMKGFMEICKESNVKWKIRDFYKIIGYQYWNVQNELVYRIGKRNENIDIEELLALYGLDYIGNRAETKDLCYNTYNLTQHFKLDKKRNDELFLLKQSKGKGRDEKKELPQPLNFKPTRPSVQELIHEKTIEGWKIEITCEPSNSIASVNYSIKATYQKKDEIIEKSASGKTLDSAMKKLF